MGSWVEAFRRVGSSQEAVRSKLRWYERWKKWRAYLPDTSDWQEVDGGGRDSPPLVVARYVH